MKRVYVFHFFGKMNFPLFFFTTKKGLQTRWNSILPHAYLTDNRDLSILFGWGAI